MRYLFVCLLLALSPIASANTADKLQQAAFPTELSGQPVALERKGQGVLTYLWADVYAAALFSEHGVSAEQAFTERRVQRLELYYFRDIDRSDVIKAADTTLARQQSKDTLARLKPDLDQLHASFQDIKEGDRYALSFMPDQGMTLERNGKVIFTSKNTELARVYFSLWLAPDGLSKPLRNALLNRT